MITPYHWKGRNGRGELITGAIEASSETAAADQLRAGGVTPVSISAATRATHALGNWGALRGNTVTLEDTLVLDKKRFMLEHHGLYNNKQFDKLDDKGIVTAITCG